LLMGIGIVTPVRCLTSREGASKCEATKCEAAGRRPSTTQRKAICGRTCSIIRLGFCLLGAGPIKGDSTGSNWETTRQSRSSSCSTRRLG
jgi:hypothetical protein